MSAFETFGMAAKRNGWQIEGVTEESMAPHYVIDPVVANTVQNWSHAMLRLPPDLFDPRRLMALIELGHEIAEDDSNGQLLSVLWTIRQLTGLLALELTKIEDEALRGSLSKALRDLVVSHSRAQGRNVPEWERLGIRVRVRPERRDVVVDWRGRVFFRISDANVEAMRNDLFETAMLDRGRSLGEQREDGRVTWGEIALGLLEGPGGEGHDALELFEHCLVQWEDAFGPEDATPEG